MDQTLEERMSPLHRYERGLVLKRVHDSGAHGAFDGLGDARIGLHPASAARIVVAEHVEDTHRLEVLGRQPASLSR